MKMRRIVFAVLVLLITLLSGCRLTDPNGMNNDHPYIYHIGEIDTPGHTYAVALTTNRAYLAEGVAGLRKIDIENRYRPQEVDIFSGEGIFYDVTYDGRYAYAACGEAGVKIIDVESPFGLELVSVLPTRSAFGLDRAGNYLYLADGPEGLRVLDVSNVYAVNEVSSLLVSGQIAYSANIDWPYLYVGTRHGFSIISVEDPYNPQEVFHKPLEYVYDIDIQGHYAYIAYHGGLQIFDIRDVDDPQYMSERILPTPARAVTVRGDYAYMAIGTGGLSIINIANPYRPREVTWHNPAGSEMNDVALAGRYVYIANGDRGMLVVEFWPGH